MKESRSVISRMMVIALLLLTGSPAYAQSGQITLTMDDVQCGEGPAALLKGAQAFVMEGNPSEPGQFTLRIKFPANYKVAPHWHSQIEHSTVLKGTLHLGMGETMDPAQAKALPVGSFAAIPPKTPHFGFTTEETIIQLHGVGPWEVNYVNLADDPRGSIQ